MSRYLIFSKVINGRVLSSKQYIKLLKNMDREDRQTHSCTTIVGFEDYEVEAAVSNCLFDGLNWEAKREPDHKELEKDEQAIIRSAK